MVKAIRPTDSTLILLQGEELLSFAQAARLLPSVGKAKHRHPASLYRWATEGRLSERRVRTYLEVVRVGGVYYTSMPALARFFDNLKDGEREVQPLTPKQKEAIAKARSERAMETLRQRGRI